MPFRYANTALYPAPTEMGWYPGQRKKKKLKKKKDTAVAVMESERKKYEKAIADFESLTEEAGVLAREVETVAGLLQAKGINITRQKEIMAGL